MSELDIFNMNIDDFKSPETEKPKRDLYLPDPKKGSDNVFNAVIRFLPNINNPKKSAINVISYWLADESDDSQGFYVHCPSTVGDKSIIKDTFWKLKKSDNAYMVKKSEHLKRKEYNYSYVQIIKDKQNPDLEGTIQILRYPKTIKSKIDEQLNPGQEQIAMGESPVNVFDFFEGKDFLLKVKVKGGYWNYDDCKFAPTTSPIKINGVTLERNEESAKLIKEQFEGITNKVESYEYKEWDSDTRVRVEKYLMELTGDRVSALEPTSPTKASTEAVSEDNDLLNSATNESPTKVESAPTDKSSTSDEDMIDEWLNAD